jgi:hypothetical protein
MSVQCFVYFFITVVGQVRHGAENSPATPPTADVLVIISVSQLPLGKFFIVLYL